MRLVFDRCLDFLEARRIEDVVPLVKAAEAAAREGRWGALALAYESAPAFDEACCVHPQTGGLPLAVLAVFDQPGRSSNDEQTRRKKGRYRAGKWTPLITDDDYGRALEAIHRYIVAGDTYQINFTYPLQCRFDGDSDAWFGDLCRAQGYGYFARLDLGEWQVLSLSPELFFSRSGDRIKARPMKGTAARGRWLEEDRRRMEQLTVSAKDRAENVMIVDLMRNDLGRIARSGSVHVTRLFDVERYPTVFQMTSTVEAELRAGVSLMDCLMALFPCGSITGAPKVRSMQIIRELEKSPRGFYTGAVGLLKPGGDVVLNVAIRTVTIHVPSGRAVFGVGGGITHDSLTAGEREECRHKTVFLAPRPDFQLIETLLLERGEWFLLDRHLRRMRDSAEFFDFKWSEDSVCRALETAAGAAGPGTWRVRLTLDRDGRVTVERQPFSAEQKAVWRVAVAPEAVNTRDVFLYHKTTVREVYERARSARPDCDDVILWNERGELTESTIANIVVERNGRRFTPARDCGLLAGTFRASLLESGEVEEAVLSREDLQQADALYLVNSVRKWMRASLIGPLPSIANTPSGR
ncbi:MAG: aminodeoxychorismate synthase component I [Candidatus Sumerlaeia bacterium]